MLRLSGLPVVEAGSLHGVGDGGSYTSNDIP